MGKILEIKDDNNSVKIILSMNQSSSDVENALEDFKSSDEYNDGDWTYEGMIGFLQSYAIEFEEVVDSHDTIDLNDIN